eukprot:4281405-Amphidinium_carterae.1
MGRRAQMPNHVAVRGLHARNPPQKCITQNPAMNRWNRTTWNRNTYLILPCSLYHHRIQQGTRHIFEHLSIIPALHGAHLITAWLVQMWGILVCLKGMQHNLWPILSSPAAVLPAFPVGGGAARRVPDGLPAFPV